jgi:putative oxidoreductase
MNSFQSSITLLGRILLSAIFITAGLSKLGDGYAGTQMYMDSMGVSGSLLPLVILTEIGAGVAVLIGLFTRISAFLLAGFTLLAALLFHSSADQMQQILFMKNLAIAGGLTVLMAHGAGKLSVDGLLSKKAAS